MISDGEDNGWADVKDAAAKMFSVWVDGHELAWAREAWGHLHPAGLASEETVLEVTVAKLHLVTLARIYQEFCGIAWDENPETPVNDLAEDLDIEPVALGILAASADVEQFHAAVDTNELLESALIAASDCQRVEVFECLKAAYGGDIQLYTRLWHTRSAEEEGEEFEPTTPNGAALQYVLSGFQQG